MCTQRPLKSLKVQSMLWPIRISVSMGLKSILYVINDHEWVWLKSDAITTQISSFQLSSYSIWARVECRVWPCSSWIPLSAPLNNSCVCLWSCARVPASFSIYIYVFIHALCVSAVSSGISRVAIQPAQISGSCCTYANRRFLGEVLLVRQNFSTCLCGKK